MKTIIDYQITSLNLANKDDTKKVTVRNGILTNGPGKISRVGTFPKAISFKNGASARVSIKKTECDFQRFHFRTVFRMTEKVTGRQNIFEMNSLPIAVFISPATNSANFHVNTSVNTKKFSWSGMDTAFNSSNIVLKLNEWYTLDFIYDIDTVGAFINNKILGVHSFPDGTLKPGSGSTAYIGTWADGRRWPFKGEMAHLLLQNDMPRTLESALDKRRDFAEWHISNKFEAKKSSFNLGKRTAKAQYDRYSKSTVQKYQHGLILYSDEFGAFELHGAIKDKYSGLSRFGRALIGNLISDEIDGKRSGVRKNKFERGSIYWSARIGAQSVKGQSFLDYELIGGETHTIGLPVKPPVSAGSGGLYQQFERGRMYYKSSIGKAFEVHGAILEKYLKLGGHKKWGFPISDEKNIKKGNSTIGKLSEFENCSIYWSSRTGACEIHGDIKEKYLEEGGATGRLGFPTSNQGNVPGWEGATHNTFQYGTIIKAMRRKVTVGPMTFNVGGGTYVCYPFKIFLGRIKVRDADKDYIYKDDSDIYAKITIEENGHPIYQRRVPERGDYGNRTEKTLNLTLHKTIVPNSAAKNITFKFRAWDEDDGRIGGSGDDDLGYYSKTLNLSNAWGLKDGLSYEGSKGSRGLIIDWSVKPQISQGNMDHRNYFFWGVPNESTANISWDRYADAFRDVTRGVNFFDHVSLKSLYYELAVKSVANTGNCFGMSLEGIYANKDLSRFARPLNRYTWSQLEKEFNIKQQYQLGASAIWWFVGQFIIGNTHDPKGVFDDTYRCHSNGDHPVICLSSKSNFSGSNHCIYPHKWEKQTNKWLIHCFDPNITTSGKRAIEINPNNNTFTYNNGTLYKGGEWSGGRLHYMPWRVLNREPRTPVAEIFMLAFAAKMIIFGDSGITVALTDDKGNNLDGGNLKKSEAAMRRKMFIPFNGFDTAINNNLYFQKNSPTSTFNHKIKGKKNSTFQYGIKTGRSEFSLKAPIRVNDLETYDFKNLGTSKNAINIINNKEKIYDIDYSQATGVDGEKIRYVFDNIPKRNNANLQMSIKPNNNGIEIITNRDSTARLKLELYDKNNRLKLARNFDVPLQTGLRVRPNSVLNQGVLKVGTISKLEGNLLKDIQIIRPK